jgi:hypothetical protein
MHATEGWYGFVRDDWRKSSVNDLAASRHILLSKERGRRSENQNSNQGKGAH